jgi:hypothetical protein
VTARGAVGVLVAALLSPNGAAAGVLVVQIDGQVRARAPWPDDTELCLTWSHSVTGGAVADCFQNRAGQMLLTRAYLHDFAAGLGEVAGRGTVQPAPEGGYWITQINEAIPANSLNLRIGPIRMDHRLTGPGVDLDLSALAPDRPARLMLLP